MSVVIEVVNNVRGALPVHLLSNKLLASESDKLRVTIMRLSNNS